MELFSPGEPILLLFHLLPDLVDVGLQVVALLLILLEGRPLLLRQLGLQQLQLHGPLKAVIPLVQQIRRQSLDGLDDLGLAVLVVVVEVVVIEAVLVVRHRLEEVLSQAFAVLPGHLQGLVLGGGGRRGRGKQLMLDVGGGRTRGHAAQGAQNHGHFDLGCG